LCRGHGVERETDESPHETKVGPQAIREKGEVDRHAAALEVAQIEVMAVEGAGKAGIVQPGGMADEGGENRPAFFLDPVR
jgi:hypothetical protein